jgi:hypothetical protein
MEIDLEKFHEIKKEAEIWYRSIDKVECPVLKRKINFNTKGLKHIKFKAWNKSRSMADQYLRLKFLRLAPAILKKSGTLQEYQETKNFERIDSNSKWKNLMVPVKYCGFIAILDYKYKVKVIVKEIYGGQPYIWSIIPFWKNKINPLTEETKKVFHEGDLEND